MIEDFRDFLRELVAANTKFLIVGAHALSVHGIPRATGELVSSSRFLGAERL